MQEKTMAKTVRTALDDLDYGPADSPDAYGKMRMPPLPGGVARRRLFRDVTLIAWPSFVELVLTQLTTMADQIMVGQMPGELGVQGLSAVGLASMPKYIVMTTMFAMNVGTTAVIARARGQQNREKANHVFSQAMVLTMILSAVMMVFGLLSAGWLIAFMGGEGISPATMALGTEYLKIQFWGFIPLGMASTITAALRGVGDTKTPMLYNTVANVLNVILNYIMIYGHFGCPALGVVGASWATVIAQTAAFAIAMSVAFGKKHYLRLKLSRQFRFDRAVLSDISAIGLPSMVENFLMRFGLMIFQRTVAGLGDVVYATHQVVLSVQTMSFMFGQAFGNASTTLTAQCLGKRRFDMAALYMRTTRWVGLAASAALMAVLVLLDEPLIALHNSTPEVIAQGAPVLWLVALIQPMHGDQFVVAGGLRGAGDTRYNAVCVFITTLVVRPLCCMLFIDVLHLGLFGAWYAIACDQILRSGLIALRYHLGSWKAFARRRMASAA